MTQCRISAWSGTFPNSTLSALSGHDKSFSKSHSTAPHSFSVSSHPHQEDETILDYQEDEEQPVEAAGAKPEVKGSYAGINASGFRDFLLKPELLRAIVDCGFEHPSEGEPDFSRWLVVSSLSPFSLFFSSASFVC